MHLIIIIIISKIHQIQPKLLPKTWRFDLCQRPSSEDYRLQEHRTEVESRTRRIFTRSLRTSSLTEHNKSALTDHATQENHVINSTGLRRRWSTESQSVLPDGSRRPYTPARKENRPWTVMRAATNWAAHTTAFLTRRLPVASRIGRTEYQLLLIKASDRGRNVKF